MKELKQGMTGKAFMDAVNKNAAELGTKNTLDLVVKTPKKLKETLNEQLTKKSISDKTQGGYSTTDIETVITPINGIPQIYNKNLKDGTDKLTVGTDYIFTLSSNPSQLINEIVNSLKTSKTGLGYMEFSNNLSIHLGTDDMGVYVSFKDTSNNQVAITYINQAYKDLIQEKDEEKYNNFVKDIPVDKWVNASTLEEYSGSLDFDGTLTTLYIGDKQVQNMSSSVYYDLFEDIIIQEKITPVIIGPDILNLGSNQSILALIEQRYTARYNDEVVDGTFNYDIIDEVNEKMSIIFNPTDTNTYNIATKIVVLSIVPQPELPDTTDPDSTPTEPPIDSGDVETPSIEEPDV